MFSNAALALAAVAPLIASTATAIPAISTRSTTTSVSTDAESSTCAQYGELETGSYIIYNDLWGESDATSGSQCTSLDSLSGSTLAWSTSWTWTGGSSIKSFANAGLSFTATQLSAISSIDTTWSWSYSGSNTLADVAYDTFTSSSADGDDEYEVMIWMDAIGGAGPISAEYGSNGEPTPVASPTIGSYSWNLYKGSNGDTTVFSFLPASGDAIESFSGNILSFYDYLVDNEGVSSSQYLITLEAGTEATTGSDAVFTVSEYSITFDA